MDLRNGKPHSGHWQAFVSKAEELAGADLLGTERLGDLAFTGHVESAERSLELIRAVGEIPAEELPRKRREALQASIKIALAIVERMKDFAASHQNAQEERNKIITNLSEAYDELFTNASPLLAFYRSTPDLALELERRRTEAVAAIEAVQQSSSASLMEAQKEAGEIVSSMRRAAAEVGVSAHASHFAEQATEHLRSGRNWLVATVAVGLVAVVAALVSFSRYLDPAVKLDAAQGVQVLAAKLVLFSLLYFAIIWCARNYKAHRHNYVVSKHRQNALSTFQAFVKASTDEATRNAVLLRATEAIFSVGLSGYVPGEPEPQAGTQIFEIVRGSGS